MDEPDPGVALHRRMLAADPTAFPELCGAYLGRLLDTLGRRHPGSCPHLIQEAVHDALIAYAKRPERYDPTRSRLGSYLLMAADRDLRNAVQRESRHHRNREPLVELNGVGRNPPLAGGLLADLIRHEDEAARASFLGAVRQHCTPQERAVFDRILAGERSTAVLAADLGLAGQPVDRQRREVKRVRDRLMKRLSRGRDSYGIA